jgi:hypothetical protein
VTEQIPLASPAFLDRIEQTLARRIPRPAKQARKPKRQEKQVWRPQNTRNFGIQKRAREYKQEIEERLG